MDELVIRKFSSQRKIRLDKRRYGLQEIVVVDPQLPRNSRYIERIGWYVPDKNLFRIEKSRRAQLWVKSGAEFSDRVADLLAVKGLVVKNLQGKAQELEEMQLEAHYAERSELVAFLVRRELKEKAQNQDSPNLGLTGGDDQDNIDVDDDLYEGGKDFFRRHSEIFYPNEKPMKTDTIFHSSPTHSGDRTFGYTLSIELDNANDRGELTVGSDYQINVTLDFDRELSDEVLKSFKIGFHAENLGATGGYIKKLNILPPKRDQNSKINAYKKLGCVISVVPQDKGESDLNFDLFQNASLLHQESLPVKVVSL